MRRFPKIVVSLALLLSVGAFAQVGSAKENPNSKATPAAQAIANSAKNQSKVAAAASSTPVVVASASASPSPVTPAVQVSPTVSPINQAPSAPVAAPTQAAPSSSTSTGTPAPSGANDFVDFIVVFQPGLARANSNSLIKSAGGKVLSEISSVFNGAIVNGPRARMLGLSKNPNVKIVEEDSEVTALGLQNPTPSWGLDRIDQANLPLDKSYDYGTSDQGAGVNAYVVDTGIDATKTDISARVLPGVSFISDRYGTSDCNGHGTHVAGTIGGTTYGVAKQVNLVPVRVLNCKGSGTNSGVINGLNWVAANNKAGFSVVNMSLGGGASGALDAAVNGLISKGVTVVVAAGNSGADACNYSPARVTDAITVAATTNTDARASYSNFGGCVDIFAPGTNITSLWFGRTATNTISGTSMATPHVVGAIARLLSKSSSQPTPAQVADTLIKGSTKGVVIDPKGSNNFLYVPIQ